MDPLKSLWALYEEFVDKPDLAPEPASGMGAPAMEFDSPVSDQRGQVDDLRASGMATAGAHEQVYGEVDMTDTTSKAGIASTFGRVQNDANLKTVKLDKDSPNPSILAIDASLEADIEVDADNPNVKTKHNFETPTSAPVETQEEYDYSLDVAFLQKYGRA